MYIGNMYKYQTRERGTNTYEHREKIAQKESWRRTENYGNWGNSKVNLPSHTVYF